MESTGHCVVADVETQPVATRGDAADDSVVLSATRRPGSRVPTRSSDCSSTTSTGELLHALDAGRLNNVDAIEHGDGFLVAATNRTTISIDLFTIHPDNDVVDLAHRIPLEMEDPYGLCMGRIDGVATVFAGDKPGRVERWTVGDDFQGELVDQLVFDSQTEGCVVDAPRRTLYVGEETAGIWAIDLDTGDRTLIDAIGDGRLVADVEGLDIYRGNGGEYLVASSQGDNTYVVYDLPDRMPLAKFRIGSDPDGDIDGVSETDGVAVTAAELPGFPRGVLVVQDGADSGESDRQNFKIVDWRRIEALVANEPDES